MREIRSPRHVDQARMKMWPLVGALAAAGLATAILGGCAMTDRYSDATEQQLQIRPAPFVSRGDQSPDAYYALGKYYFYQGRLEQAKEAFWDAVRRDQNHVDALNGLGVVYDRLGQYDAARKVYEAALLKGPQAAHVWANLGYSLILAGRRSEALAPLQKAVALDPSNAVARQHLASVSAEAAATVAAASPAEQTQIAAAAQAATAKAPPPAGPVASVVTARGIETAGARTAQTSILPSASSSAVAAPNKPVRAERPRQAEALAQSASAHAKETLNQPQAMIANPVIASVAKRSQVEGDSIVQKVALVHSLSLGGAEQKTSTDPAAMQEAAPEVKAAPAASRAEARSSGALAKLRIEVSNGNGVTGMARAVGTEMRQTGLNIARITNARPFNKPQTVIMYRPELKSAAMELAQAMPAKPKIVARDLAHRNVDVRVVLGADSALALKNGAKSPYLVASLGK